MSPVPATPQATCCTLASASASATGLTADPVLKQHQNVGRAECQKQLITGTQLVESKHCEAWQDSYDGDTDRWCCWSSSNGLSHGTVHCSLYPHICIGQTLSRLSQCLCVVLLHTMQTLAHEEWSQCRSILYVSLQHGKAKWFS